MFKYKLIRSFKSYILILVFIMTSAFYIWSNYNLKNEGILISNETQYENHLTSVGVLPFGELFLPLRPEEEQAEIINKFYSEYLENNDLSEYWQDIILELKEAKRIDDVLEVIFDNITISPQNSDVLIMYIEESEYDFTDEEKSMIVRMINEEFVESDVDFQERFSSVMEDFYLEVDKIFYTRDFLYYTSGVYYNDYQKIVEDTLNQTSVAEQYGRMFMDVQGYTWMILIFVVCYFNIYKWDFPKMKNLMYTKSYSSAKHIWTNICAQFIPIATFMFIQYAIFLVYLKTVVGDMYEFPMLSTLLIFGYIMLPSIFMFTAVSNFLVYIVKMKIYIALPAYLLYFQLSLQDPRSHSIFTPLIRHDYIHIPTSEDIANIYINRGLTMLIAVCLVGLLAFIYDSKRCSRS